MGSDEETFDAGSTNMITRENGWDVSWWTDQYIVMWLESLENANRLTT